MQAKLTKNKEKGIFKEAMQDKAFRKKWKLERLYRTLLQKECLYCGEFFKGAKGSVIHHKKMWKVQREVTDKEMLLKYYKSLEDTDLICVSCHSKQHPSVLRYWRKGQRKLRL